MTAFDSTRTNTSSLSDQAAKGLVALGRWLVAAGYRFVAITPETHRTVNDRSGTSTAFDARDVFGWSRRFRMADVPDAVRHLLESADVIERDESTAISRVRFSTIGDAILVHSAFPTSDADCVFFGPDTYRFVQFIHRHLPPTDRAIRMADVGCGSGAGGLSMARAMPGSQLVLADINEKALAYARVNALLANVTAVDFVISDVLDTVNGDFDLIVANPPYMKDPLARQYRDGGGNHGTDLSVRIAIESLARLVPGGRLLLYTGAPVIDGVDLFLDTVSEHLHSIPCTFTYAEIDPDVFGEELRTQGYERVERIAAVGLVVDLL